MYGTASPQLVPVRINGGRDLQYTPGDYGYAYYPRSFTPLQLFSNGEQGAFYIPRPVVNGAQALFQDDAGAVAVTADGDPVGLMLDQSGNAHSATQNISAARPLYNLDNGLNSLSFDGVDDYYDLGLVASGLNGSAFIISIACRYFGGTGQGEIFEAAENSGKQGGRILALNNAYVFQTGGGSSRNNITAGTPGGKDVLTLIYTGADMIARINGEQVGRLDGIAYVSATTNSIIGSQDGSSAFAEMEVYGAVSYIGSITQDQIDNTEAYLASLMGITL